MGLGLSCKYLTLLLAAACAACLVSGTETDARSWYVLPDSTGDAPTIPAGLDSASYGDTVLVAPGIYQTFDDPETKIYAKDGVWLLSEGGPDVTVIEMCGATGITFFTCEGARASGFWIRPGSGGGCEPPPLLARGISCYECTDVIVEHCIIEGVDHGIYVRGASSEWWKPVFRNNVIRDCYMGIYCWDIHDPGRPFFQGNTITECAFGAEILDSAPNLDGNEITHNAWGLSYGGHCGGNCTRNVIAYNEDGGVWVYSDPPLASPDFNGTWLPEEANDFYGNGGYDIRYMYDPEQGQGLVMAIYNWWGSDCPNFASRIYGSNVVYSPWLDSTHTVAITEADCQGATEPTTWGSIKAMFR
ncbi:MAG: right-handed parallel beta-helix repeat-containing protein [Candidatus Eisenbacteria bacterium]